MMIIYLMVMTLTVQDTVHLPLPLPRFALGITDEKLEGWKHLTSLSCPYAAWRTWYINNMLFLKGEKCDYLAPKSFLYYHACFRRVVIRTA